MRGPRLQLEWRTRAAILCLLAAPLFGQRYNFHQYGLEQGLTNLVVLTMTQDRAGFLWAGTEDGLCRYGGSRFTCYGLADGLPSSYINHVYEAPSGVLWAGTRFGLARRDGYRFRPVELPNTTRPRVLGILSDRSGRLLVATDRGLFAAAPAPAGVEPKFESWNAKLGLGSNAPAGKLFAGPEGVIYFCSGSRVYRLENDRIASAGDFHFADGDPPDAVAADKAGNLWVRSRQNLYLLKPGAARPVHMDGVPPASSFGMLSAGRSGDLFVSTNKGLWIRGAGEWEVVDSQRGLPADTVTCQMEDREGSIWVGFRGLGLARWLGYRQWEAWTTGEGLSHNHIWDIRRDARGSLWVGTNDGLNELPAGSKTWKQWSGVFTHKTRDVKALAIATDGAVWGGFGPDYLFRLDPRSGSVSYFRAEHGIGDPRINSMAFDPAGRLWVGTGSGLYRGSPTGGVWRFELEPVPGNPSAMFSQVLVDEKARVWTGGSNGMCWLKDGQWNCLKPSDGIVAVPIRGVVPERDGTIWVGYLEALGLSRLQGSHNHWRHTHFSRQNGLASDRGWFVGRDTRGWIWHGSGNGADVFDGRIWRHFGRGEGLVWDDCNSNSFWPDTDGSVWIGTSKGLARYLHKDQPGDEAPPPIAITEVSLGQKPTDLAGSLSVPYADNSLVVRFGSPTFVAENSVRYRYRLLGSSDAWTDTAQTEVPFSGLGHGRYTFEVGARSWSGHWSESARFSFQVLPPWWASPWFTVLMGALLLLLGWGLWRWRVAHLLYIKKRLEMAVRERTRELEQEKDKVERQNHDIERLLEDARQANRFKTEFLATMSHEIRTPMNGVMGMTELLLNTDLSPMQRRYAETVGRSSEALLGIINSVLDLSKIEAGRMSIENGQFSVCDVVEESLELLETMAERKGIELVSVIGNGVPCLVSGDAGKVRQVLINLLGNATKFTARGDVAVRVRQCSETESHVELEIDVRDTGIGMSMEVQSRVFNPFTQADGATSRLYGGTGLGLTIAKHLVELMGGAIQVESELGRGSRFWFTVRLGRVEHPEPHPAAACAGKRVLLAAPAGASRRTLREQMELWGVSVSEAATAEETLELMSKEGVSQPFDVILYSEDLVESPVLPEIRARASASGGRVVLMMYLARREASMSALELFDEVLVRPVRQSLLVRTIASPLPLSTSAERPARLAPPSAGNNPAAADAELPQGGGGPRILVADDNHINRVVAMQLVRRLGYEADAVSNGREVLEALERGSYALILMDCQMPELDGYQATAEIRRREAEAGGPRIPIVAMTADVLDRDRNRCLECGMDDYVSKPVRASVIAAALKTWLTPDRAAAARR